MKEKIDKLNFKLETFVYQRILSKELKGNPGNGGKYLQVI